MAMNKRRKHDDCNGGQDVGNFEAHVDDNFQAVQNVNNASKNLYHHCSSDSCTVYEVAGKDCDFVQNEAVNKQKGTQDCYADGKVITTLMLMKEQMLKERHMQRLILLIMRLYIILVCDFAFELGMKATVMEIAATSPAQQRVLLFLLLLLLYA